MPAISIADAQGLRSLHCCPLLPRQAHDSVAVRSSPLRDAAGECSRKEHKLWKRKHGRAAALLALR